MLVGLKHCCYWFSEPWKNIAFKAEREETEIFVVCRTFKQEFEVKYSHEDYVSFFNI